MEILLGVMKSELFNLGMNILFNHVIRVSFFNITMMYSPLKKREEIWGESHLAVACGIVTEDDVSSRLWLFSPVTVPQASTQLDLLQASSRFKIGEYLLRSDHFVMIRPFQ